MPANPAGTRIVTSILEHGGPGQPVNNGRAVTAKLNSPGFINGGTREKVDYPRQAIVDPTTGAYSLILEVNADIDPAGTSWTIKEPGNRNWTIIVPAGDPNTPVTLRSCLVADPTNPNPLVAGISQAELDDALDGLTGTYARLPADPPTEVGQPLVVVDIGPPIVLGWGATSSPDLLYGAGLYGEDVYSPAA